MTDESLMPWGKHKGEKLINIPAEYLIWLLENNKCGGDVREYIIDNKEVLETEIKRGKKQ